MATTGATTKSKRAGDPSDSRSGRPITPRVGVLWGYPFSLVRRLFVAFATLLLVTLVGTWALAQPGEPVVTLIHVVVLALAIFLSLYLCELIGLTTRPLPRASVEALFASIGVACAVLGAGYLLVPDYAPPSLVLCGAPALAALSVYLQRRWLELHGQPRVVAAALYCRTRQDAARAMVALQEVGPTVVRRVLLPPDEPDRSPVSGIEVGSDAEDPAWLRNQGVEYLIAGRSVPPAQAKSLLTACAGVGLMVESVGDLVARSQGKVDLKGAGDLGLFSRLTSQARPGAAQRLVDLVFAVPLLLVSLPLWILVAAAVFVTSGRPIFYRQERVGLWGRPFQMLKFRTMRHGAEAQTGPVWAEAADPRVTSLGRVLRRLRLDEMPQAWNVIRGDMSMVGPRPERPFFVQQLARTIPLYEARHSIRPGLTGWAQIRHPYGSNDDDAREKLAYDLFYILNRSLTFYFAVLLETAKVVLFRRGAR
ncbi:MAG: exopolysaccharide biosynthesis polyprenyl glycosylphosphotransferase [Planctomycetaceae bacterium]